MKILFDQGTPVPLRRSLHPHVVDTAYENKWGQLSNGDLIQQAEDSGYSLLITTDQNLKYQQNLSSRKISILVLKTTSWPRIKDKVKGILHEINSMKENDYVEIHFD